MDSPRIEAARTHLDWGSEALWRQLVPLLPGLEVEVRAQLGSTNSVLLARARGEPGSGEHPGRRRSDLQPTLLVAERQTQGRGRQDRPWLSGEGNALTFSLALALQPAAGWSGLSLAVGCALADALEPAAPPAPPEASVSPGSVESPAAAPRLLLKWPNDLWLRDAAAPGGGRKLGGILIETTPVGMQRLAVVGVGLNVRALAADADTAPVLTHGRASVDELDPAATPPAVLARVALPLVQALRRFEAEGFAPFAPAFARRDLLAGRALRTHGAQELQGVGAGVDAQGLLLLRDASGRLQAVGSGEVSVRPC
jgi:BirA family biotin operon repressor/biotin-[acetyl-CoA-carboxylase] ligase